MMSDRSKLTFWLLLAPLVLWLSLLIVLPHVGLFWVSLSEKVGVQQYETGFANYAVFFNEPLYWNTFARTAFMSIASTLLTLLIGFPVAYYIAKLTRGRTRKVQRRHDHGWSGVHLHAVYGGTAGHNTRQSGR